MSRGKTLKGRIKLLADGISVEDPKAFQSFASKIRSNKSSNPHLTIPKPILKHLQLCPKDVIEVAIRKISREDAAERYNFFFSYKTVCPKCGLVDLLKRWPPSRTGFIVLHHVNEHRSTKYCRVEKEQCKEIRDP